MTAHRFYVMTLFPDMVRQTWSAGILGRAKEKGLLEFHAVDIRDYTNELKHHKVDDYTYGGGAGLLMQAQPIYDCWAQIARRIRLRRKAEGAPPGVAEKKVRVIYVTPQGTLFSQRLAQELARETDLIFLCGHYEGVDERVLEEIVTDQVSIGDYVLTGGELPAMVMTDAIARLVPGVLHNDASAETETFSEDLLEYPQYTRPEVWRGKRVPEILISGDHARVDQWRLERSVERTRERRPDLYDKWLSAHPPQPKRKRKVW